MRVLDFCDVFEKGTGNLKKKGAGRVLKRLRDNGAQLDDLHTGTDGRPPKLCRISDLKASYPKLLTCYAVKKHAVRT